MWARMLVGRNGLARRRWIRQRRRLRYDDVQHTLGYVLYEFSCFNFSESLRALENIKQSLLDTPQATVSRVTTRRARNRWSRAVRSAARRVAARWAGPTRARWAATAGARSPRWASRRARRWPVSPVCSAAATSSPSRRARRASVPSSRRRRCSKESA